MPSFDVAARLKRLMRKSRDLYATSGSVWRVLRYNARYGAQKLPQAVQRHVSALRARPAAGNIAAGDDKLAICIPGGGLGDHLVVARLVRDIEAASGPLPVDIYSSDPKTCAWILAAVPGVDRCLDEAALPFQRPAVTLEVMQYPILLHRDAKSDTARRLAPLLDAVEAFGRANAAEIARRPYLDAYLAQKATYANRTRADALHDICGVGYGGDRLRLAIDDGARGRHGLAGRDYVTIHNGFNPQFVISARQASKCYPHFEAVVARLRAAHPGIAVVLLGIGSNPAIAGCSVDLRGRTSLPETAAILAGARLHIDNEGGLVHLAACVGTRSCVLFGPTPADYFGYPRNTNLRPPTCGGCWWVNDSWMDQCPRGFAEPICLSTQPPEAIAQAVREALAGEPAAGTSVPS